MVLPFNVDDFIARDVVVDGNNRWLERFRRLYGELSQQGRVVHASDWPIEQNHISYRFAAQYLFGLARQRARHLDARLVPMAMWAEEGAPPATVAWWRSQGHGVERVRPAGAVTPHGDDAVDAAAELLTPAPDEETADVSIKAIMFADVFGYSRLREGQQAPFVEAFLGGVARLLQSDGFAPRMRNTWGDALYMVFDTVDQAGSFALALVDFINATDWQSLGLPGDFTLRVSVHAGPVFACNDPVLQSANYLGTHVSHAARLEPITPPGNVYATEAFAALAAAGGVEAFSCEYVGQTAYAKGYGTHPAYHVRWR
jgi:class 3 adenylate cyclase